MVNSTDVSRQHGSVLIEFLTVTLDEFIIDIPQILRAGEVSTITIGGSILEWGERKIGLACELRYLLYTVEMV
jgi:hypothetical protein